MFTNFFLNSSVMLNRPVFIACPPYVGWSRIPLLGSLKPLTLVNATLKQTSNETSPLVSGSTQTPEQLQKLVANELTSLISSKLQNGSSKRVIQTQALGFAENFRKNLQDKVNQADGSQTDASVVATGGSIASPGAVVAATVEKTLRKLTFADKINYPLLEQRNQFIEFVKGQIVVLDLKVEIDLQTAISCGIKPFNHTIRFYLVPQEDGVVELFIVLESVREQIIDKLRPILHVGVKFLFCKLQVFEPLKTLDNIEEISLAIFPRVPKYDIVVGITARGSHVFTDPVNTVERVRALSMCMDFKIFFKLPEGLNTNDVNRLVIMGHKFEKPDDLFAKNKQQLSLDQFKVKADSSNSFLAEGAPLLELLEICQMLETGISFGELNLSFYDIFRTQKYLYPVQNVMVSGLRFTSKTSRAVSEFQ